MTELPTNATAPAVPVRPGVPVWRVGKPDAILALAVEAARTAIEAIAADENIGSYVGARSEGVRVVTHLFDCKLPGYAGWTWFATLTRVSRSKDATVNEVGLLPTDGSVLAPPWVPWAERVRPEDAQAQESEESPVASLVEDGVSLDEPDGSGDDEPDASGDDEPEA
jgi:Protein of unknown function (DUF3027)